MLDTFKNLTGSAKQRQAEELQALIASAKEERGALNAMLTQISIRSSKLAQMGKTLEQVEQKADAASATVSELHKKVSAFDHRLKAFDIVEKRFETLAGQLNDLQQVTEKLTASDGELQKHRQAVNSLASQALETQATIETLRRERATLDDLRSALREASTDVKQSIDGATVLKTELDGVRTTATGLQQDYARIREASREAREDAAAATENVKEIEKKLGPLVHLQELTKSTEERLASLNALAEHVSHKAKSLEAQKHAIDHAVVQANRLNEMVWSMDVQINRLTEGNKQVQRAEETVARMEKLAQETASDLEGATSAREEFTREFARLEKDTRTLSEYLKNSFERLAVEKKEFETFDQRLKALQAALAESETRTDTLLAKDKVLSALTRTADGLNKDFQGLVAQADELASKQGALEALSERLAQVDELQKRTSAQHEALKQSRQDLETLRKEIQEFHRGHAEAVKLSDKLAADRAALDTFGEHATLILSKTPELESRMDTVLNKMAMVEEGTKAAARLGELSVELDAQLTRVSGRLDFIEKLELRINSLHVVTSDVDRKLGEQLSRRAELETLKSALDTVGTHVVDAQQKLEGIASLQHKLVPLATEIQQLNDVAAATQAQVKSVRRDETVVNEQRGRLIELVEQSKALAADVVERSKQVQSVNDELMRATAVKEELLTELSRVQARQRDALNQTDAAEDHLKRAETMLKQLEQRRTQLMFSEKKIAGFEQRLHEMQQHTAAIEQKIKSIADREALVRAVKAEVDSVHSISARSKADLQFVADHRSDIAAVRTQVEDLLGRVDDTDQKIAAIEGRRKTVEEVQGRANAISNLLDDITVNLEVLGEQKAVIDHIGEKLARLDFVLQEAQNAHRALQREREIAERIEQSIKTLRGRAATPAEKIA